MKLTSFCNVSDLDGYCYTHQQWHGDSDNDAIPMAELYPETAVDGHECPTCGTFIGPCVRGKQHGEVLTPADGFYDSRVLGREVPNDHQYGYCIDCKCPCRWDTVTQRWVTWTGAERLSWKAKRDQEIRDRQRAIEDSLA